MRVAHLAPDAPAVDVCLRPHAPTGAFTIGPVLKSLGVTTGLSYPDVTAYVPVPAGQYDVRIVGPNAMDCSAALAGLADVTDLPALGGGAFATVAAEGLLAAAAGSPFGLHAYLDDHTVGSGKIKLRFLHASPGTGNVDLGIGTGSSFTALFQSVSYGSTGSPSYLETNPVSAATIVARPSGTQTDALVIPGVSIPAGAVVTAFAVGNAAGRPLKANLCIDLDTSKAPLANCSLAPLEATDAGPALSDASTEAGSEAAQDSAAVAPAHLRVAHLSPDAPAVDVCLRPHAASGEFPVGPVLKSLGVTSGLPYSKVTAYLEVAPGQYDVRIVAPNASGCSSALGGLPDTTSLPALPSGAYATVAAEGLLAADAGPKFKLNAYIDDRTVDSAKIKLRFLHASPGTGNVDVGIGTGESFVPLFTNVAYAAVGSPTYLETSPVSGLTLVARPAGTQTDALVIPGVSFGAGIIATAFAIGNAAGAPLKVDLCLDLDSSKEPLSNCSVVP